MHSNDSPIVIRAARTSDLPVLLEFEQDLISHERPFDPGFRSGEIHYYDIPAMINSDTTRLLVAEMDGRLVGSGYARIEKAKPFLDHEVYGYLGFMYVDPDFRGKGINQKIIEGLKAWCLERDIHELRLEVYPQNAGAVRAYEKAGFRPYIMQMRLRN